MISPEDFYEAADHPAPEVRRKLWKMIERQLPHKRPPLFIIPDRRSFIFGIAASVVLYLASMGAIQVVRQTSERSQEPALKLDRAYQSAIRELESVVPHFAMQAKSADRSGQVASWEQQLGLVSTAITDLRHEIETKGPSTIKLTRLRELYTLKLQVLQSMIEHGDMEL